jgi:hypothetical protein
VSWFGRRLKLRKTRALHSYTSKISSFVISWNLKDGEVAMTHDGAETILRRPENVKALTVGADGKHALTLASYLGRRNGGESVSPYDRSGIKPYSASRITEMRPRKLFWLE